MKLSINELLGYAIETLDGTIGTIKDFLFDEDRWVIRYAEVDPGAILPERKVLIPRMFLKEADEQHKHFKVELNRDDIERCPGLDSHQPVSRRYESELNWHYRIVDYWSPGYHPPAGKSAVTKNYKWPLELVLMPANVIREEDIDTNLRSFNEVKGYEVHTNDGRLGRISDLLIDSDDWSVVYAVIDTAEWQPWSKKVVVAIAWAEEISYVEQRISVRLFTEEVKNAPEYDPSKLSDEAFDKELMDYYGKIVRSKSKSEH